MLLAGTLLAFSLFDAGCKQGVGDRCEVNSDCDSNICNPGGDPSDVEHCFPNSGLGGTPGNIGGSTGSGGSAGTGIGGAAGTGGAGGAASDASSDGSGDAASTD